MAFDWIFFQHLKVVTLVTSPQIFTVEIVMKSGPKSLGQIYFHKILNHWIRKTKRKGYVFKIVDHGNLLQFDEKHNYLLMYVIVTIFWVSIRYRYHCTALLIQHTLSAISIGDLLPPAFTSQVFHLIKSWQPEYILYHK